jgi:hypothetical protein
MNTSDAMRQTPSGAATGTGGRDAPLAVVDCDVHPAVQRGVQGLYEYMPDAWRQRFIRKRAHHLGAQLSVKFNHPNGAIQREDARPPGGLVPGSDPTFVVDDLLERHGVGVAVLNSLHAASICAALANADESIVFASAFNSYFVDRWLARDQRFSLAIAVPSQDPEAAAAEVERLGAHPQVAAVAVPLLNVPLGDRRWYPIYRAASRWNLPILVHGSGAEGVFQGAPAFAGGSVETYLERYLAMTQIAEANIASLVFSGTFERFQALKFVFVEFGFLWLLPLLWRMDRAWRQLRHEVPWTRRSPIDYVHEHCRFTTQPMDEPADPRELDALMGMLGCDVLCFSSDYPHWDNEMPGQVLTRLPGDVKRRVFAENARQTFRLLA